MEHNWAGTHTFAAAALHRPPTIAAAQQLVAESKRIRPLGTRHSFIDVADGDGDLLTLVEVQPEIEVSAEGTVTVTGGTRYAVLATWLEQRGLALHNLGSLPHISVAGAVATATHGSGTGNGNLATAVRALELIDPDGELRTVRYGDPEFAGSIVALGALGPVARVTLAVQPSYRVRQDVFAGLDWKVLLDQVSEVFAAGYSVSLFTDWGSELGQLWLKTRLGDDADEVPDELFGARRLRVGTRITQASDNTTVQGGVPGPWSERLPHFRSDVTPSVGDEIQSEYLLALSDAAPALTALQQLAPRIADLLHVSELRTVAADELWLSTAYRRQSLCIHFTWRNRPEEVAALLPDIEAALAPFGARPHWGKLFRVPAVSIAERYERLPVFRALVHRHDPAGKFRNRYLDRVLGIAQGSVAGA